MICPSSAPTYDALTQCVCVGPCKDACSASLCQHENPDQTCIDCVASVSGGCGAQIKACNDDP
jgi:hypothetical protein